MSMAGLGLVAARFMTQSKTSDITRAWSDWWWHPWPETMADPPREGTPAGDNCGPSSPRRQISLIRSSATFWRDSLSLCPVLPPSGSCHAGVYSSSRGLNLRYAFCATLFCSLRAAVMIRLRRLLSSLSLSLVDDRMMEWPVGETLRDRTTAVSVEWGEAPLPTKCRQLQRLLNSGLMGPARSARRFSRPCERKRMVVV
jgi:hypothetical protein